MRARELRKLATKHLLPFFSGAEIVNSVPSTRTQSRVAWLDPCTIAFKVNKDDSDRLTLRRSQKFDSDNGGNITEKKVVEAFVDSLQAIETGLQQQYRTDLLASLERRVVGKAVAASEVPEFEPILLLALDQMAIWASRLYEGAPITAAIGFDPDDSTVSMRLSDMWKFDFAPVISNGHDTLLTANHAGNVIGHETLSFPGDPPPFAPYRLAPLAEWAQKGRVVVALNRTGEILLLRDQRLVFARRSGKWHFLTFDAILTQLARPTDDDVRQAMLETALDVSFARSGGCLGAVLSARQNKWKSIVVSEDDHLEPEQSVKAKIIKTAIADRKFQELDRRLRQELVAIDGATVIDHHGNILAVGAILKIQGGSTGGGRLAAAKALSNLGIGIKISQDGSIRCYHDGDDEPKVSLM